MLANHSPRTVLGAQIPAVPTTTARTAAHTGVAVAVAEVTGKQMAIDFKREVPNGRCSKTKEKKKETKAGLIVSMID